MDTENEEKYTLVDHYYDVKLNVEILILFSKIKMVFILWDLLTLMTQANNLKRISKESYFSDKVKYQMVFK